MKKYIKPKIVVDNISITHPIADLSVNENNVANFDNVPSSTWSEWESLFE